jgi:hypothetical protein
MRTQKSLNNHKFTVVKNKDIFHVTKERIKAKQYGSTVIVPHVCNNLNVFGAGFAANVATEFPVVKLNFHMLGNKAKLGHSQFVNTYEDPNYKHKIVFANMIAQNKLINKSNPRPLNYEALVMCMKEVRSYTHDLNIRFPENKVEIHCPKFGSGLAGGDWNFIACLIDDIWSSIPVFVYMVNNKYIKK